MKPLLLIALAVGELISDIYNCVKHQWFCDHGYRPGDKVWYRATKYEVMSTTKTSVSLWDDSRDKGFITSSWDHRLIKTPAPKGGVGMEFEPASTTIRSGLTPFELTFLMHCYTSPEPSPKLGVPIMPEVLARFRLMKVIEESRIHGDNVYDLTQKGKDWLDAILNTPLPLKYLCADYKEPTNDQ